MIGQVIPERVAADPIGVQRAYETGRINTGGLGLASTPIIDARTYTDFAPPFGGDIHTRFHSFVVRERLRDANGTAANQVIFISNSAGAGAMQTEALTRMEAWLAAIHDDHRRGSAAERVIRNRPDDLSDACWTSPTTKIEEQFEYQRPGACETLFPTYGDTRTAAGGGLTGDTFKCQLQPLDVAAYPVTFTPEQQATAAGRLPDRRVRLEQAGRRRAAAARRVARLRNVTDRGQASCPSFPGRDRARSPPSLPPPWRAPSPRCRRPVQSRRRRRRPTPDSGSSS